MKRDELMSEHVISQGTRYFPVLNWEVLLVVAAALVLVWIGLAWDMGICLGLGAACGLSLFSMDFFRPGDSPE